MSTLQTDKKRTLYHQQGLGKHTYSFCRTDTHTHTHTHTQTPTLYIHTLTHTHTHTHTHSPVGMTGLISSAAVITHTLYLVIKMKGGGQTHSAACLFGK